MQEKKTHPAVNMLIALAILVAFIVGGYFYATRDRSSSDLLVESFDAPAMDGDLLSALGKLRTITLDDSIFANPVFTSLSDFGTVLTPQPAGRQNPFAPLNAPVSAIPTGSPAPTQ